MRSATGIFAIIPARAGSKGVPGKNIRPLAGHPLIAYSIAASKAAGNISRTIVSTDSEEIAGIARRYGAETPFVRPPALAEDDSPDIDFVVHALNWFRKNEGEEPDFLVHLRPTTPIREPRLIAQAIDLFVSRPDATSLRSGHPAPESPFKWFRIAETGFFLPFATTSEVANRPRQKFPEVYIPDGYVDVLRTSFVRSEMQLHGSRILPYAAPACIEVDTPEDFEYLELWLGKHASSVLDILNAGSVQ
jgi:N-acylneuraminate cytidylyltransferase